CASSSGSGCRTTTPAGTAPAPPRSPRGQHPGRRPASRNNRAPSSVRRQPPSVCPRDRTPGPHTTIVGTARARRPDRGLSRGRVATSKDQGQRAKDQETRTKGQGSRQDLLDLSPWLPALVLWSLSLGPRPLSLAPPDLATALRPAPGSVDLEQLDVEVE